MKTPYFPDEVIAFVKAHYQRLPNKEILGMLKQAFPNITFTNSTVTSLCAKHKFTRTPEERKVIMARLVETGVKRNACLKQHEKRSPKIGDVRFAMHSTKRQWIIKLGERKNKPYAKYLWEQAYGAVPGGHRVDWIDDKQPLTIDNLQLIKFNVDKIPIGGITTWKNLYRRRELIKTAEGRYELLLPYLWRKHTGEIPPGMWVEKIDPFKPTTIDNLQLVKHEIFSHGSRNLDDWYVKATLAKSIDKATLNSMRPELLELQRTNIILKREIKAVKNAGNAQQSTTNNPVDGAPSEDA